MKVVITGTSGMVGHGVLLECLEHESVTDVLIVNRRSINLEHPKLKEVIVKEYEELNNDNDVLKGYDSCFFCAGVSVLGKSEEEYHKLTYDLTINFAEAFLKLNANGQFIYVSGAGTDSTEKGRSMWARVKGKTENKLLNMAFKSAFMFRPGFIQPLKGIKSRTKLYAAIYAVFSPLYVILKHFPAAATSSVNIGKAMIFASLKGSDRSVLGNKEINELASNL